MQLTEIRINLCGFSSSRFQRNAAQGGRLRAFCSITFDDTFVIRDIKLIDGNDGLFLAMPSRKLMDHCAGCGDKNHLRARFCNHCGYRLDEDRFLRYRSGNGQSRLKLHADIAHPINGATREKIERQVFNAYHDEVARSQQPGYIPPAFEPDDLGYDEREHSPALRMTGTRP